jgi:hypothetical protein
MKTRPTEARTLEKPSLQQCSPPTQARSRNVNRRQWSQPVDSATAHARARGRYRYNRARQINALERRTLVVQVSLKLLQESIAAGESFYTRPLWGKQALIAHALGVHPSTISRDIKKSREISFLVTTHLAGTAGAPLLRVTHRGRHV